MRSARPVINAMRRRLRKVGVLPDMVARCRELLYENGG